MLALSRTSLRMGLACMTALASAGALVPFAQGEEAGVIEEVVVTATKRGAQSLQDVPFAVQAISGDVLAQRAATDFNDFFRLVPGLSVFDQGPGDKRYIIRGVNSVGAGTVSLYLDEVIITGENAQDGGGRQPDIKLFDMDRIEVLKGPQGTTFGSSSLSGTIRYITRKPKLDTFETRLSASLRTVQGGEVGWNAEGAINIPLVEDKAAIRVAGYYLDQGGYIDNIFANNVNNDQTFAGRISARFTPSDNLTVTLMAMYQNLETDGPAYFNRLDYQGNTISVDRLFQADVTRNGFDDETQIYSGVVEYHQALGTITATASYFKRDTVFNRDASLALEAFLGLPLLGAGRSIITQPKERELQTYELRYASDFEGPFQVLIGVFYQAEDRFFESIILSSDANGNVAPNPVSFLNRNVDTSIDELAFFGEVSFDITDRLTITGGVRYYDFSIDEIAAVVVDFGGGPGDGFGPKLSKGEDGVIFKGNLAYRINDDINTYFQVSQGFRPGGTNDQTAAAIANVVIPAGFNSDSLVNYEIGLKSRWLDGRMVFNVAAYLIDWSDIQLPRQATDGQVVFEFRGNGGGATIKGLEAELTAYPADGLELGVSANFSDAQLSEDNPIPSSGMKGDQIPYVPDVTLSATVQYEWAIGSNGLGARVGGDVSYIGRRNTELRPDNALFVKLKDYALLNLRAGIDGDNWSASVVVRNVTNNDTVVDIFRIVPGLTPDGFIINRPRSIIFTLTKRM